MKPKLKKDCVVSLDGKLATITKKIKTKGEDQKFQLRMTDDFSVVEAFESQLTADLLDHPECVPQEVMDILNKYEKKMMDGMSYRDCASLVKKLEAVGYTCEYYLDANPYFLRKSDIKLIED